MKTITKILAILALPLCLLCCKDDDENNNNNNKKPDYSGYTFSYRQSGGPLELDELLSVTEQTETVTKSYLVGLHEFKEQENSVATSSEFWEQLTAAFDLDAFKSIAEGKSLQSNFETDKQFIVKTPDGEYSFLNGENDANYEKIAEFCNLLQDRAGVHDEYFSLCDAVDNSVISDDYLSMNIVQASQNTLNLRIEYRTKTPNIFRYFRPERFILARKETGGWKPLRVYGYSSTALDSMFMNTSASKELNLNSDDYLNFQPAESAIAKGEYRIIKEISARNDSRIRYVYAGFDINDTGDLEIEKRESQPTNIDFPIAKQYLEVWKDMFKTVNGLSDEWFDTHIEVVYIGIGATSAIESIDIQFDYKFDYAIISMTAEFPYLIKTGPIYADGKELPLNRQLTRDEIYALMTGPDASSFGSIRYINPNEKLLFSSCSEAFQYLMETLGLDPTITTAQRITMRTHPTLYAETQIDFWTKTVSQLDLVTGEAR